MPSENEARRMLFERAQRLERQSSRPPPPPVNPVRAAEAVAEARDLAARGQYARAIPLLASAADSPRYAVDARRLQARLEQRLGQPQRAIATLKQALHTAEEDPATSAQLFSELADVHAQMREMGEAAYYQRRAARLAPERPELYARLTAYDAANRARRHQPATHAE